MSPCRCNRPRMGHAEGCPEHPLNRRAEEAERALAGACGLIMLMRVEIQGTDEWSAAVRRRADAFLAKYEVRA